MVTTNQNLVVHAQKMKRKESKHITEENYQITEEELKRRKKQRKTTKKKKKQLMKSSK